MISSEFAPLKNIMDPYLQDLEWYHYLALGSLLLFIILYTFFSKQLRETKESIKAFFRKRLHSLIVNNHLSKDGQTIETTETPSFFHTLVLYLDKLFLIPDTTQEEFRDYDDDYDNHEEGFQDEYDDDDDDDDEKEEGFQEIDDLDNDDKQKDSTENLEKMKSIMAK
jgi:hypothetical protein